MASTASSSGGLSAEKSALMVTTVTSFMGPFMISSVNVALPAIQREFSVNAVLLSWIATSYLLAMAVFLVPAGKIGDIYGRKKVFTRGLVLYTAASFLSAAVPAVEWLVVLRVVQGVGAALFVTTGMAILTSVFPPAQRGRVIGIYVAAVYIGLSVGPFAGGLLTQHLGWRSIFLVVGPVGAVSIWTTVRFLREEWAEAAGERLDVAGSVLCGLSILLLVYGATRLPGGAAWMMTGGGVAGLIGFVFYENRIPHPVFEVDLFKANRLFVFSSLAALIHYSATYAVTFLLSLYLQYIKGMTPQSAGTVLVAQPVMMAVFSPLAGRLADRIEPRYLSTVGMTITALGLLRFAFVDESTPTAVIIATLAFLGFGFALFSSPNMSAIMGAVAKKYYGIASSTVATMRLLGQMSSMATATVVFAILIGRAEINPAAYGLFLKSLQTVFGIFSGLCMAGICFSMMRGRIRR